MNAMKIKAIIRSLGKRSAITITLSVIGVVVLVVIIAGSVIGWGRIFDKVADKFHSATTVVKFDHSKGESHFPDIDTSKLSPVRQRVIQVARQEFATNPPGTKYSQGIQEPWCADFVSWVYKESGNQLKNPHTSSWRIPGTITLREYYQQIGRFKSVNSGYTPRPGDVAIYRSSPIFGDHTQIVLKENDGVLTTVGGNENFKIRVFANTKKQYDGLLGYGTPD